MVAAIRAEARAGHDLSYSCTEKRVPSVVRAAERVFGTWGAAVNAAGFDYEAIRRYRKWTREKVIARIRELYEQGEDQLASRLPPPGSHAGGGGTARRTLFFLGRGTGSGRNRPRAHRPLSPWSLPRLRDELLSLETEGVPLDRKHLTEHDAALLAAVYRLGGGLIDERRMLQRTRRKAYRYMGREEMENRNALIPCAN